MISVLVDCKMMMVVVVVAKKLKSKRIDVRTIAFVAFSLLIIWQTLVCEEVFLCLMQRVGGSLSKATNRKKRLFR